MQKSPLVAVDTNFPLLLAEGDDDARDALELVRARIRPAQILVPPTALAELFHQSQHEPDFQQRELAGVALTSLRSKWRMQPASLSPQDARQSLAAARQLLLSQSQNFF